MPSSPWRHRLSLIWESPKRGKVGHHPRPGASPMRFLVIALVVAGSSLMAADAPAGGATKESKVVSAEDQDKAVAELQKLGGKITLEGKVAVGANLADIKMTDAGLVYLDALPQLKSL